MADKIVTSKGVSRPTHEFHDFAVQVGSPEALDRILNQWNAALCCPNGQYEKTSDGYYLMRVYGNPGFVKFACEHQGYCKIIREISVPGEKESK